MATFGGQRRLSFQAYHAIPDGWEPASIEAAHASLHGTFDVRPAQMPEDSDPWLRYRQTLYNVANGVRDHDAACVELAIRFIELHFIGSYAGYIRTLMARRLKRATLTAHQKRRLSDHFLDLLRRGERCYEFRDYVGLWRTVATPSDIAEVERLAGTSGAPPNEFLIRVVARLRNGRAPQARAVPTPCRD